MTTRENVLAKVNELLSYIEEKKIPHLVDLALDSGGFDYERYEDNYVLPKIILHAILLELVRQTTPLQRGDEKTAKNIATII